MRIPNQPTLDKIILDIKTSAADYQQGHRKPRIALPLAHLTLQHIRLAIRQHRTGAGRQARKRNQHRVGNQRRLGWQRERLLGTNRCLDAEKCRGSTGRAVGAGVR